MKGEPAKPDCENVKSIVKVDQTFHNVIQVMKHGMDSSEASGTIVKRKN
jgi:hypothetical protein